jgi:hypothetical protein
VVVHLLGAGGIGMPAISLLFLGLVVIAVTLLVWAILYAPELKRSSEAGDVGVRYFHVGVAIFIASGGGGELPPLTAARSSIESSRIVPLACFGTVLMIILCELTE